MKLYRLFVIVLIGSSSLMMGSEKESLLNQQKNLLFGKSVPGEYICFKVQPATSSYQSTSENHEEWRYTIPNKKKITSTNFVPHQVHVISSQYNNSAENEFSKGLKGAAVFIVAATVVGCCCGIC